MAGGSLGQASAPCEKGLSETAMLAKMYVGYFVFQQVTEQATLVADNARPQDRDEVADAAQKWFGEQMGVMRSDLEKECGSEARARFEQFYEGFSQAEQDGNPAVLEHVSNAFGFEPPPADFVALKKKIVERALGSEISSASDWLGELQTWVDLRRRDPDTPPLEIWMARNEKSPAPIPASMKPKRRSRNPLADAEADLPEFVEDDDEGFSPLDSFDSMREERRQKAMEEAQEGMRQVAEERQAAEEEYAKKKLAAAQAEADAMKRQAEKLAAVEQEALEQRKKSWGNRLKSIVGATLSAGIGAFTGGVGSRAGEEAANAIFNN